MGFTVGKSTDKDGVDCFDGSVPEEWGMAGPAEKVTDALFRIFQEQANEPTEFVLVVVLLTIASLFMSVKFFKRWQNAQRQVEMEAARRRQQELYRQSYHFGKTHNDDDDLHHIHSGDTVVLSPTAAVTCAEETDKSKLRSQFMFDTYSSSASSDSDD
jgi:hypothetical protein